MSIQEALIGIEKIHRSIELKDCMGRERIQNIFDMLKDSLESEIVIEKCVGLNKKQTTIDNFFCQKDK